MSEQVDIVPASCLRTPTEANQPQLLSQSGEENNHRSPRLTMGSQSSDIEIDEGEIEEQESHDSDEDYFLENEVSLNAVDNASNSNRGLKRKYTYVNRKRKVRTSVDRSSRWLSAFDTMTEPKLRRITCCKKFQCFKHVPYNFFMERCRHILSSSAVVRKSILNSMVDAERNFMFNGKTVCVRFMKKAFHFSTDFLARDRKEGPIVENNHAELSRSNHCTVTSGSASSSSKVVGFHRVSPHKDAILSFMLRLGEDCSEKMPDAEELHLPFFQKQEVYSLFVNEYKKLYNDTGPSSHYFLSVWKKNCSHIKVRKASRFTICEVCEEIRAAMENALVKGHKLDHVLAKRAAHLKMVRDERMEYQKKKDRARLTPSEYCSIIVDGADQHEYGLPHFPTKTKEQKGHSLKLKLVGLLEHEVQNMLHIYTMTEEHETGANHVIECIHRFINYRRNKGPLPRKFFVQMDNCTRENKNRYLLSYLESLVALDVFDVIEAGFLPKGHTHEDVDQCFSQSSGRLRVREAITVLDMHSELSNINKGHVTVCHLKRLANWSGLCEMEKCVHGITSFTQYRYFKFSRTFQESSERGVTHSTTCHVRLTCYDSWRPLTKTRKENRSTGFLKFCPDLRKTPPLKIKCPDGQQKVIDRFNSEEGRVNNVDKMMELHKLRQFVFSDRVDPFHWDLESVVESSLYHNHDGTFHGTSNQSGDINDELEHDTRTESSPSNPDLINSPVEEPSDVQLNPHREESNTTTKSVDLNENGASNSQAENKSQPPSSKFSYDLGSFVAVQPDSSEGSSAGVFWIGKVVSVEKSAGETFVRELKVHWYSPSKEEDPLTSDYHPLYEASGKTIKEGGPRKVARRYLKKPWTDQVDTDTVIVTFNSLTKKHCLPFSVRRRLGV